MKIRRMLKTGFAILAVFFLYYVIYVSLSIYSYGKISETVKTDAAIVLGAGVWGDKPSPVFAERINHAIYLYKSGYTDKLIFTGGKSDNSEFADSFIARKYAMENSVPEKDIFIEEQSAITQENIIYAAEIARGNNIHSVTLVSDPLHMKRAMLMAKDYGLTSYSSPTPTTMYRTFKTKSLFLLREVFFYIGYQVYRIF